MTSNTEQVEIPPTKRCAVRSTLLGMMWNADYVLEQALSPHTKAAPQELFQKCKGVVIMAQSKGGFLLTGHCGTGVMMAKTSFDPERGSVWSPPVGVYNGGYSFGAALGFKQDNYITFIMDDESMQDFVDRPQSRIGVVASCTLCKSGGELEKGMNHTFVGKDSKLFLISRGAFAGPAIEMETFETCQDKPNRDYYKDDSITVAKILFQDSSVSIPKGSLVNDLHRKLRMLERGETWVPGDLDRSRSGQMYVLAEKAEKEARQAKK